MTGTTTTAGLAAPCAFGVSDLAFRSPALPVDVLPCASGFDEAATDESPAGVDAEVSAAVFHAIIACTADTSGESGALGSPRRSALVCDKGAPVVSCREIGLAAEDSTGSLDEGPEALGRLDVLANVWFAVADRAIPVWVVRGCKAAGRPAVPVSSLDAGSASGAGAT